jgi:hypothetical protein
MDVVRPAAQLDPLDRRLAAYGVWRNVVEFEESPFLATALVLPYECALSAVPDPDLALYLGRDVTRPGRRSPALPRLVGGGKLCSRQVLEESRQRPVEDLAEIG